MTLSVPAILGLATGVPSDRYSQAETFQQLERFLQGNPRARAIFRAARVAYRHSAATPDFYLTNPGTEARNLAYFASALPLGEATIRRCLASAGLQPTDVDYFTVVSCTGIDIPGLDLRLAQVVGLRADLRRTCVLGMGCYAAFPGLLRAHEAVLARPGTLALVLALELCSFHIQPEDDSTETVIMAAIFSDGAAAALIGDRPPEAGAEIGSGPSLLDSATHCDYTTLEHMAFHLTDHGFLMRLSAYVPELLAADIRGFVDGFLRRNGLEIGDVSFWGIHPGGARILDHMQSCLDLSDEQMAFSRQVLHDYGNMSSPTILFVLEAIQRSGQVRPGDYGVLLGFGPGLTIEGALVQW
jgi:alkylresorcinol/alkylpyrone synthase